jgi:flavin reductase (DIM6/NTAB) family NADH-FMN oxidoreductase RutF
VKIKQQFRQAFKKIVLGGDLLPLRFFIEQPQPQQEITVLLHGHGPVRDVTHRHGPASTIPFTLWIAFDAGKSPSKEQCPHLSLHFSETNGRQRLLGKIGLSWFQTIEAGSSDILVFQPRSAVNYCYPILHRNAQILLQLWRQRERKSKIKLSALEHRATSVLFTCPRPISLVSVAQADRSSMFPLNVMGEVDERQFAFALTASKIPAQFLQAAGRFALSVTPIEQAPVAFALAANHNTFSFDFKRLPFPTRPSQTFGLPVPVFTPRVREMEIESVHDVGTHSMFVARTISDEHFDKRSEFSVTHGVYQAWRLRHGLDSMASIAKDARIRAGTLASGPEGKE